MSIASKVFVQFSNLDMFGSDRKTDTDVKAWIANQGYIVNTPLTTRNFSVQVGDSGILKAAYANDCNRMSAAAIESISGISIEPELKRSGAWGVIRLYYSAFFAAHAILRIFGISFSQLNQTHVGRIYEMADLTGHTGGLRSLENGFYAIKTNSSFSHTDFTKYKDSHKDMWKVFLGLLDELSDKIESAATLGRYKVQAFDILSSIKSGITRSRCTEHGNWLSEVRNSVNYQHSYGVWFPYEKGNKATDYISSISDDWKKPVHEFCFSDQRNDIKIFFEVATLINSLFRDLLLACSSRHDKVSTIFSNGSLKLLNNISAA